MSLSFDKGLSPEEAEAQRREELLKQQDKKRELEDEQIRKALEEKRALALSGEGPR
jgi:twitching motility protein PilU